MRLSAHLAQKFGLSRKFAKALIHDGKVFKNGCIIKTDIPVEEGEAYTLDLTRPALSYTLDSYVIQNSGEVVFFYKPAGMHTGRLNPAEPLCLEDIVKKEFPNHRLISRLDYPVDGVIAAIKEGASPDHQEKRYLAWVEGAFPGAFSQRWDVDASKRRQVKAFPSDNGIMMHFKRLDIRNGNSLVEIILEKAHRHQVRAVLAALGYPILGDTLYNGAGQTGDLARIQLHCACVIVNGQRCESPFEREFRLRIS